MGGIPYWPIELATLASFAKQSGDNILLYDLFGNNPFKLEDKVDHYLQGECIDLYFDTFQNFNCDLFIIYAISYMSHDEIIYITKTLKKKFPFTSIGILENSQAVTAYSLQHYAEIFLKSGASGLICGEALFNWENVKKALINKDKDAVNVIKTKNYMSIKRLKVKTF